MTRVLKRTMLALVAVLAAFAIAAPVAAQEAAGNWMGVIEPAPSAVLRINLAERRRRSQRPQQRNHDPRQRDDQQRQRQSRSQEVAQAVAAGADHHRVRGVRHR